MVVASRGMGLDASDDVSMRMPEAEDGADVHDLIARCAPLDENSRYCNLLQCTDFAETCALAERGGRVVGWVSGYRPPREPDTLFVWQVAVAPEARGMGLGGKLIRAILRRPANRAATQVKTTITEENEPSWRLFRRLAEGLDAAFGAEPHFLRDTHFAGRCATEHMVTIGPFKSVA